MKKTPPRQSRTGLFLALGAGALVIVAALAVMLTRPHSSGTATTHGQQAPPADATPAKLPTGWSRGPALDADSFRLVVLKPKEVTFGAGSGVMAGPFDTAEPGYWARREKSMNPNDTGPATIMKYYKVSGESMEATTEAVFPAGYLDIPLLGWSDGRTLSLTDTNGKDGPRKEPGPVGHSYTLVTPQGPQVMQQDHFFYTSEESMGFAPAVFPGLIQLYYRADKPPAGPFPVDVWVCPSNTSGHSLPRIQALATGNSWRGSQRVNVVVDAQGRFLFTNDQGTGLEPDARWQAAGDMLRKADSTLREVAVADNFVAFGTPQGIQLLGLDGSQHLIAFPSAPPANLGAEGAPDPAADSCAPLCRIRALDANTVILNDRDFNRLTLVRRTAGKH